MLLGPGGPSVCDGKGDGRVDAMNGVTDWAHTADAHDVICAHASCRAASLAACRLALEGRMCVGESFGGVDLRAALLIGPIPQVHVAMYECMRNLEWPAQLRAVPSWRAKRVMVRMMDESMP